jgi:polyferredoxin
VIYLLQNPIIIELFMEVTMKRQSIRKALVVISFLLFPITIYYLSPILIIQGLAEGIIAGSFIFFALLFAVSLFLGRAHCGWVCPAGGLKKFVPLPPAKKRRAEKAIG